MAESIILCPGNSPGGIQAKHGKPEILYAAPVEPCRGNGRHVQEDGMMQGEAVSVYESAENTSLLFVATFPKFFRNVSEVLQECGPSCILTQTTE